MPGQGFEELKLLNKRIDELIINYNTLKSEYGDLKTGNEALKAMLQNREAEMKELEIKYDRLKLTGALLRDGENATEAKRKITELVREIDKCIALLNR